MLQNLFSMCQFRLTKWSFLLHNTARNAPNLHPSHDSILELRRTFRECCLPVRHDTKISFTGQLEEYKGSNMIAYVLLNLLNELGKRDKTRGLFKLSDTKY